MANKVTNVSNLLKRVYRGEEAVLEVYGRSADSPVWMQGKGTVTLNLGYGRFSTISMECYEKIRNCLAVKLPEERTVYEKRRTETDRGGIN